MKKKAKPARVKLNPDTIAKNMKKQLGEVHASQVVSGLANLLNNINPSDINLKDIFDLNEVKRNQRFWEQVNNILQK